MVLAVISSPTGCVDIFLINFLSSTSFTSVALYEGAAWIMISRVNSFMAPQVTCSGGYYVFTISRCPVQWRRHHMTARGL